MTKTQEQFGGRENRWPVHLHIDELILHGFSPGERHRIAAAMQKELARLIRNEGTPASAGMSSPVDRLDAGAISIRAGSTARATGARIATAVYRGLQRQGGHAGGERFVQPASGGHRG